jgi:hypothetical protein
VKCHIRKELVKVLREADQEVPDRLLTLLQVCVCVCVCNSLPLDPKPQKLKPRPQPYMLVACLRFKETHANTHVNRMSVIPGDSIAATTGEGVAIGAGVDTEGVAEIGGERVTRNLARA